MKKEVTSLANPHGRLRLLDVNAGIFESIVPGVVAVVPEAVLLVVADPPDPLADLTRLLAKHDRVVSTGTFLDSLRFATHLAEGRRLPRAGRGGGAEREHQHHRGLGASQYGIGAVTARLTEAILRDERIGAPVGSFHAKDGVT